MFWSIRFTVLGAAAFLLPACTMNTVPDSPDFTAIVNANYLVVADCATPQFRRLFDWTRTDLPTRSRVEFSRGGNGSVTGLIVLEPDGPNRTRVTSKVQRAIYGADYYEKIHRPIFEGCARA